MAEWFSARKEKTIVETEKEQKGAPPWCVEDLRRETEQDDIFGFMAGKFEIVGDIESPLEDWKYWDPEKNLEE